MSRQEFYENVVYSLTRDEFEECFGCAPADIQAFDYDFNKVHWNANLEWAYNDYTLENEVD